MRKLTIITASILMLLSCSSTPDPKTPEEINADYLAKAQTYITAKIDGDSSVVSVTLTSVDSIENITQADLEFIKINGFQREVDLQVEFANKLMGIDQAYTGEIAGSTQLEVDKAQLLLDSLDNWKGRAKKMNDKKTIAKRVFFKSEALLPDGSKDKSVKVPIFFDLEGDIDASIMDGLFD